VALSIDNHGFSGKILTHFVEGFSLNHTCVVNENIDITKECFALLGKIRDILSV
jgi:hypothetical protein